MGLNACRIPTGNKVKTKVFQLNIGRLVGITGRAGSALRQYTCRITGKVIQRQAGDPGEINKGTGGVICWRNGIYAKKIGHRAAVIFVDPGNIQITSANQTAAFDGNDVGAVI